MAKLALVHFNHQLINGLVGWPDFRTIDWEPNYGDMLVCASILKQVAGTEGAPRFGFGDVVDGSYDIAIVRGSTYLHNEFDFEAASKTIDSLNSAKVVVVGLGAQNPTQDLTFLDGNVAARNFVARLNERCVSVSVRGRFTGEVLARLGLKNIRLTGCPSLFYHLKPPRIKYSEILDSPARRLGISLHTGLMGDIFCRAPDAALRKHGQLINFCIKHGASTALFEQGVAREFRIADRQEGFQARIDEAQRLIVRIDADRFLEPIDIVGRMVSVQSIEEWLGKARDLEAILGFRFHGNMVAMLQGIPCYYYVYDSRIQEFCDIYKLPFGDVESEWSDPLVALREHDWDSTNAAILKCFEEIGRFYSENGIQSNLKG